jgi:hypothetical protein
MSLPGPGDFCHGCNRLLCRCPPELDPEVLFERAYEAGHEACLADGYSERPLTEWVYRTGSRVTWDAEAKRLRHHMTPLRFAGLTWRTHHASAWAYARWFERQHGLDLEAYLAGYDDAGAGLPSEAEDPEHHARCLAALVAGEPAPSPRPTWGSSLEVASSVDNPFEDDGLPF